jgi:hypothetical protein
MGVIVSNKYMYHIYNYEPLNCWHQFAGPCTKFLILIFSKTWLIYQSATKDER